MPAGSTKFKIRLAVDRDGILTVKAEIDDLLEPIKKQFPGTDRDRANNKKYEEAI